MPRLFIALWPPPEAIAALADHLAGHPEWPPEGWRAIPAERWHVTLRFHGEAEVDPLVARLDRRFPGLRPPLLRLAEAVSFRGVAAVGVAAAGAGDRDALRELARGAGVDPSRFRPHVTVGRTNRRGAPRPALEPLRGYQGPWWRPEHACLVHSRLGPGGPTYTVLHRVRLSG
jgi:2'-5' RNA ligase